MKVAYCRVQLLHLCSLWTDFWQKCYTLQINSLTHLKINQILIVSMPFVLRLSCSERETANTWLQLQRYARASFTDALLHRVKMLLLGFNERRF